MLTSAPDIPMNQPPTNRPMATRGMILTRSLVTYQSLRPLLPYWPQARVPAYPPVGFAKNLEVWPKVGIASAVQTLPSG